MPRFHVPQPLAAGQQLELPANVAHHINVVRMEPGDTLTLFNGDGGEYTAVLTEVQKKKAWAEVKVFEPREAELPFAVTLAQALPEGAKMDWIIEKAVELGVAGIQPLAARRCVVRLSAERAEKKLEHWNGIVISASEQCGRNRLAPVAAPVEFREWISQQDLHRRVILTPRATESLADWARHQPPQALSIMVGPEGGFSDEEEAEALRHGALPLSIGPRVLRTETAALAAVSILAAAWGGI
ncbi:16S rRNA (uracil(1498)-N(3))-methyltransferase [Duganella sp. Root1480D1]|uniref:16S rRNA (uracil(1498)-N(3))-methyltransferase n=1 Tax=Duganella sp. Root1480D1 TaxID=1736471 RepID=UPI00070FBE80|nr:16S rRNA (uracil(1498)-N(3))-methyltransferase [Duganella sp. Root1480D1]KQZ39731.1 16S rRNA methyltransferase [Duganella sp. Root1480D1]